MLAAGENTIIAEFFHSPLQFEYSYDSFCKMSPHDPARTIFELIQSTNSEFAQKAYYWLEKLEIHSADTYQLQLRLDTADQPPEDNATIIAAIEQRNGYGRALLCLVRGYYSLATMEVGDLLSQGVPDSRSTAPHSRLRLDLLANLAHECRSLQLEAHANLISDAIAELQVHVMDFIDTCASVVVTDPTNH